MKEKTRFRIIIILSAFWLVKTINKGGNIINALDDNDHPCRSWGGALSALLPVKSIATL
ncbi:MAG: hypothetical protein PVH61_16640 [Candidatus Aminicenantes bacterium]|jgi:hypothetical protein